MAARLFPSADPAGGAACLPPPPPPGAGAPAPGDPLPRAPVAAAPAQWDAVRAAAPCAQGVESCLDPPSRGPLRQPHLTPWARPLLCCRPWARRVAVPPHRAWEPVPLVACTLTPHARAPLPSSCACAPGCRPAEAPRLSLCQLLHCPLSPGVPHPLPRGIPWLEPALMGKGEHEDTAAFAAHVTVVSPRPGSADLRDRCSARQHILHCEPQRLHPPCALLRTGSCTHPPPPQLVPPLSPPKS